MSLPQLNFRGQTASVTMMELRANPGELIDRVSHGLVVTIEKAGKRVATLAPSDNSRDTTVIHSNGNIDGPIPLTFRRNLGHGY